VVKLYLKLDHDTVWQNQLNASTVFWFHLDTQSSGSIWTVFMDLRLRSDFMGTDVTWLHVLDLANHIQLFRPRQTLLPYCTEMLIKCITVGVLVRTRCQHSLECNIDLMWFKNDVLCWNT